MNAIGTEGTKMTGIIGAGRMAQAVGSIAVKAGHQVMLSNSRGPERSGVSAIGCEVGTVDDVAAFGEMLIAPIHLQLSSANPATPLKKKAALNPQNSFPHLGPVPELDSVEFATAKVLQRLLPGSKW
jgi:predicted dinucleotide-binding enzyme